MKTALKATVLLSLVLFATGAASAAPPLPLSVETERGPGGEVTPPLAFQTPPALEALKQRLLPLFELGNVVFTDADESTGRLVIGISDAGIGGTVLQRLLGLGISPAIVDIVMAEPIYPMVGLRDQVRPLEGGTQINFPGFLCTLGFNVVRNGVPGFVTNSHCTTTQGGVENTPYYQPTQSTSGLVGTEMADPQYSTQTMCTSFWWWGACRTSQTFRLRMSDSAFVAYAGGTAGTMGRIARTSGPNNGSLEITGAFNINSEGVPGNGATLNKVGRTTGWTQGTQTASCVDTGVSGANIVLECQNWVANSGTLIVQGGDSGSPVFSGTGADVTLAGILWGGSANLGGGGGDTFVYSPIANIEQELGPLSTTGQSGPPNGQPVANNDTYNATEDQPLVVAAASGVLDNDSDPDNDPLSASLNGSPTGGSVSISANGAFTFTPNANFSGSDSFQYTVSDGKGGSDNATVTINVAAVADNPNANNDTYSTLVNTVLNVAVPGVLGNDSDPDGGSLSVSSHTQPSGGGGSVTVNANGSFSFTPANNFSGNTSFSYQASDGGLTDSATVTITVEAAPETMHIGDLDGSSTSGSFFRWNASVSVLVVDAEGDAVSGAQVSGSWSGGGSGSGTCTTASNGRCTLNRTGISVFTGSVTYSVTNVTHATLDYAPGDNDDPDNDSNGNSIEVERP